MFFDLNVPYTDGDRDLSRKLNFAHELGYGLVALNHFVSGHIPNVLACAIPDPLPSKDITPRLQIRRRVTLTLTDTIQNARLNALAHHYDILALRPIDERTLRLALDTHDCDIISIDMSQRLGFHFKLKMFSEAIKAGKRVEICYAQGILGDASSKRNLISNATQLIRATRGRGLIISSEAKSALGLRGPWDVINLAAIWGLGQERGHEAISREARGVVVRAQLKRTSFRGVINVVHGGDKPAAVQSGDTTETAASTASKNGVKRKAEVIADQETASSEKPLSKTQQKKRAKIAAQAARANKITSADTKSEHVP